MKRRMKMMIFLLMFILCCVNGTRSVEAKSSNKKTYSKTSNYKNKKHDKKKKKSELQIHFIDVGEGDAILLTFADEAMMIDYGTAVTAAQTYEYVRSQGVSKLKYAVCTHPHPDHMGGMNYFLKKMKVKRVLLTEHGNNKKYYKNAMKTIKKKKIPTVYPKPGKTFKLGEAKIRFLAPSSSWYERENDYSLVAKVTYKNTSFLLTGDAEKVSEQEMLARYGKALKADVLKLGHHGNFKATSEEFLNAVDPECVVISCDPIVHNNPSDIVLDLLQTHNLPVLRTDERGTFTAISNGQRIYWK